MSPGSPRWTLDVAVIVGSEVIRKHFTRLRMKDLQVIEAHELAQPGPVYLERSRHVMGDKDWSIVYPIREEMVA